MTNLLLMAVAVGACLGEMSDGATIYRGCSMPLIKNGRAKYRSRGRAVTFKCFRGYSMVGDHADAICDDGQWFPNDFPLCIKSGCSMLQAPTFGFVESKWAGALVTFDCLQGYSLVGDRVLVCDGWHWNGTAPDCQSPFRSPPTSCNFRDAATWLCGWQQADTDQLDWLLSDSDGLVPNATPGTGPGLKRAAGDSQGRFLYVESSATKPNDSALLISPAYTANYSRSACFSLTYMLNGATMGSLRVYQLAAGAVSVRGVRPLAVVSGNQGTEWHLLAVALEPVQTDFQVAVEGVVGNSYLSDIAVDSVQLLSDSASCAAIMAKAKAYQAPEETERESSPASCFSRCDLNTSEASALHQWTEGACDCTQNCLLGLDGFPACCSDFGVECRSDADSRPVFLQRLGVSWGAFLGSVAGVAVTLLAAVAALMLVCVVRTRRGTPRFARRRHSFDQSNLVDDADLNNDDDEPELNFSLATPSAPPAATAEDGNNAKPDRPIIFPRQLTEI